METFIGIDLGGTRIKAVEIDRDGNVLQLLNRPTNDGDEGIWKQAVLNVLNDLLVKTNNKKVLVGIAAPGLPDKDNSTIAFMPGRMNGLENFNWTAHLKHSALVINDAVAAMMAEATFGAGVDHKNLVMLTLGTGVGGAILIDGKPYQGMFNKAGHIGHMVIDDEGDCDVTGMPGSLEECIGNCSIQKRSEGKFASTHELLAACKQNDQFAKQVWLKSVRQLALGIASVTNILSPEMVILGGGIAEAGDELFIPLKEYMNKYEWRAGGNAVEIVKANYADIAGAIGAASFAMSKYE